MKNSREKIIINDDDLIFKKKYDIPTSFNCGIHFSKLKNVEEQIHFNHGKIRLCKVYIAENEFYNAKEYYNSFNNMDVDDGDGDLIRLPPYKNFQYKVHNLSWKIFIESKFWGYCEISTSTIGKGEIRVLNNGLPYIYVSNVGPYEMFKSLTEKQYDKCTKFLTSLNEKTLNVLREISY